MTIFLISMKIEAITEYKRRWCAWLEDGRAMVSNGSMELLLCEPVNEGMKVIRFGIVAGMMMRTEEDFRWCVENYREG